MAIELSIQLGFYIATGIAVLLGIVLLMIGRNTNAFKELKARRKGYIMVEYFGDNSQLVELKPVKVSSSNVINDDKYGSHILERSSVYTDTNTRIPRAICPTSVGQGVNIPIAKAADALNKLIGDPRHLSAVRQMIDEGKEVPELEGLRETISFSPVKHFLNAMSPNSLNDAISKEVMLQSKMFGKGLNMNTVVVILLVLGGIALIALVLVKTLGNNTPQVIETTRYVVGNASNIIS